MAWTETLTNGRNVHTEAITLGNTATVYSSTINFVGSGADFTAMLNTEVLNTAGANTTEVQGSFDDVTWVTLTSSFATDFDAAMKIAVFDPNTSGNHPYYRLAIAAAGDDSANTATVKIIATPYEAT